MSDLLVPDCKQGRRNSGGEICGRKHLL